mgnify:CR=1 FL=1
MKNFKNLIKEAHLGNPLNEDGFKKNKDSYIKISEPSFRKDKNNPNFLSAYIKYDTGPGVGIALGKETMAGQIRRLSSAEALRQMEIIGRKLNDSYDLEDLDINDLENGVVELFAVSDDFIGMDPRSELSMAMLEENIDKKYSDFLVALRDSGATNMFGAAPYLQAEFGLDKREAREVLANWMRSFGESLKENQKYDDEDIVIYDGEEHIIMRKDGNMVYIRPLEDSAILGKRDEIKVPARALAYKSDLDKMYDKYKPKDEMNEVDEKWDKIARDEYGKPWMELSIAQKQEMLSYANRETEKQFQTDYEKRRKGDLDDEYDGMTDYQRGRMDEDMNDPVLMKARAAKIADEKEMARQAALDKKYGSTFMDKLDAEISLKQELQDLKDEREQLMIDMEQEAEPEGGEIADRYGSRLNDIDAKMSVIKSELDDLRMYESLNEGKFYITRNLGRGQGKALVGGYDLKRDKKLPPKVFKSYRDAEKEVKRLERGGSMGGQMTAYIITDKDMNMLEPNGKKMFESVNENTLGDLVKKYGKDLINFVIGIDELTKDEIKDVEYLDDRIQIHLEEPEIRQKYLPEGEEFEYKAPKDTDRDDIKVDPDTEFKIDLKHLIQKHKINEDEIPMYLTNNREFEKAVIVSTSFNDFEKRVYGILGPKYFKLAKIENPGAMKDYYDSIRVTRPSMEESFDLDVTDSGNPETIGDESIERESASPAFETKLTRIYKSIK